MKPLKIYIFQKKEIMKKVNKYKQLSLTNKLFTKITFIK